MITALRLFVVQEKIKGFELFALLHVTLRDQDIQQE
jgi:hypothetical protein